MKSVQLLTSLSLACLLQACGSSSSSDSDPNPVGGSYPFSLTSTITNNCGISVPFTEVEVLLQDDNWQHVQTYTANENGVVSFTASQPMINFTLVAKTQTGEQDEGLEIISYSKANATTATFYQATHEAIEDNTSCECITQDLVLRHSAIDSVSEVDSSLPFTSVESVSPQSTRFNDVTACRQVDGEWPAGSFMVTGLDASQNLVGSADFLSDFSAEESGEWELSAVEVAEEVIIDDDHQLLSMSQLFNESEHFTKNIELETEVALVFDNHLYVNDTQYMSVASYTLSEISSLFGSSSVISQNQVISSNYFDALSNSTSDDDIDIDYDNFTEISDDGSYDYSEVSGHEMAVISFTYGFTEMPVTWTTYGEIQGMLPTSQPLVGYESTVNADSFVSDTQVLLLNSSASNDYEDYVQYYQNPVNQSFIADMSRYQLNVHVQ